MARAEEPTEAAWGAHVGGLGVLHADTDLLVGAALRRLARVSPGVGSHADAPTNRLLGQRLGDLRLLRLVSGPDVGSDDRVPTLR